MLAVNRPLSRSRFVAAGVVLLGLKMLVDSAVLGAYGRAFSPSLYLSPLASTPRDSSGAIDPALLGVFACAIPFMAVGLWLTLRRLRDAGLPRWLVVLFFVPFAKFLFFAVCAVVPRRDPGTAPIEVPDGPYRGGVVAGRPPAPRGRAVSLLVAVGAGTAISLGAVATSVWLFRDYGVTLFLFAPAIASFATALVLHRLRARPRLRAVLGAALLASIASLGAMVAFAMEGAGCVIMASPLLLLIAAFGAVFGHVIGESLPPERLGPPAAGALLIFPCSFAVERAGPIGDVRAQPVESVVVVDAPPEAVWKRVLSFPPLPPPSEALFRAGIAAPLAATIDGQGVGAVRRCEFTTGTFVEPIDTWVEARELGFSIASEPDPMREWTPWQGPRPPHLDGYLRSRRGRFVLEPIAGGKTRLVGTTWYEVHMEPARYWRVWADAIIRAIHMRVLRHIAALAEADVRAR